MRWLLPEQPHSSRCCCLGCGDRSAHHPTHVQGLKLSLEQTRVGIMKGSIPQLDSSDAYWAFMTGDKVEAAADPM